MGVRILAVALLLTAIAWAQDFPEAPVSRETWTTFGVLATEVVADGVTTRVLYQRHYDEIDPMAKPFVHAGVPGQVGASLLGAGVMSGTWYVLHRTHHDRAAGWFLRSTAAVEGYNIARQFAILRTSKK